MKTKICLECKKSFTPTNWNNIRCGHKELKGTCSYIYRQRCRKHNKYKEYNKTYKVNNPEDKEQKRINYTNYIRKRRMEDKDFYLITKIRNRIHIALSRNSKSTSTINLLGCSIKDLKIHLQKSAIKNGYKDFDINNYKGEDYHIDHIRPCASFDMSNEKQQKECFHYKNLQILTSTENLSKGDRY